MVGLKSIKPSSHCLLYGAVIWSVFVIGWLLAISGLYLSKLIC
jgi:hypothetical protein